MIPELLTSVQPSNHISILALDAGQQPAALNLDIYAHQWQATFYTMGPGNKTRQGKTILSGGTDYRVQGFDDVEVIILDELWFV